MHSAGDERVSSSPAFWPRSRCSVAPTLPYPPLRPAAVYTGGSYVRREKNPTTHPLTKAALSYMHSTAPETITPEA